MAASVPGLLCPSGRRRPEDVSIFLSSLLLEDRVDGGHRAKFAFRVSVIF